MRPVAVEVLLAGLMPLPVVAEEYTFVVENNGDQKIVKIEVSEDGTNWAEFGIGSGIDSATSVQLAWGESTNNAGCQWQLRATFGGGDALSSDWINFCEEDVVVTFEFDK